MKSLQRTYPATPETIWELWTTPEGIARWWAPDGFVTEVQQLDVRPGGELVYRTEVTMAMEPMHDDTWTERLLAGRANELDNLAQLLASRN